MLNTEKLVQAKKLEVFRLLRGALRESEDPANTVRALWLMLGPEGFCVAWLAEGGPRCDRLIIDTLLGTVSYDRHEPLCTVKNLVTHMIETVRFLYHRDEREHLDEIADRLSNGLTQESCRQILHVKGVTRTSNITTLTALTRNRLTKSRTSAEITEYHADAMELEKARVIAELSSYENPYVTDFVGVLDLGFAFARAPA